MINIFTRTSLSRKAGASSLLALCLLSCTETKPQVLPAPAPALANEEAREPTQYTELKWSDEFDGGALNQANWVYEQGGNGWGNRELQNYTNSTENVFTEGGNLVIRAKQQQLGGNAYTSGRIITKGKQSFQFGRLDVRAKVPKGKGVWPAIWMLGSDIDQNNWPVCGEIDIMELRGSKPREMLSTMHFGTSSADHRYVGTTERLAADLSDDFHVFSMVRSKNLMRFYLDGREYYRFTDSSASPYPFNNPFFVILNVAVGGDFDGNPDATTTFPQQMQVDYVRFYQYK
ncbi:glycoside hydrolase family 16 protein [Hymenobacter wooponensis]|uniref:Glycoside hydrolase family 16 protein n=1 Tax=Hymenobacter wooponensis TaxID=1525360 RepID=A0A4Z0MJA7_9BACT|nr:glycoside hydrolase family 16 protein [Hymenobacter wooponensis]TGD79417.1 glycoside hydrolase family 16 protein [Hymenobacter wooponensis]